MGRVFFFEDLNIYSWKEYLSIVGKVNAKIQKEKHPYK